MDRRSFLKGSVALVATTIIPLPQEPVISLEGWTFRLHRPTNFVVMLEEFETDLLSPIIDRMLEIVNESK